ncbi:hypothetical protein P8452_56775 [Trifolium repens]|nr:hypothetical protein P8452_56775 [Trifolium repens]
MLHHHHVHHHITVSCVHHHVLQQQHDTVASYIDDQLSHTIGGTTLQFDTSEKTDGVESLHKGILVDMLESSDPSRLILNIQCDLHSFLLISTCDEFSCAYNLDDKNQLVDMLRKYVHNVKLICESSCEKTNSIEIKGHHFSLLQHETEKLRNEIEKMCSELRYIFISFSC